MFAWYSIGSLVFHWLFGVPLAVSHSIAVWHFVGRVVFHWPCPTCCPMTMAEQSWLHRVEVQFNREVRLRT